MEVSARAARRRFAQRQVTGSTDAGIYPRRPGAQAEPGPAWRTTGPGGPRREGAPCVLRDPLRLRGGEAERPPRGEEVPVAEVVDRPRALPRRVDPRPHHLEHEDPVPPDHPRV